MLLALTGMPARAMAEGPAGAAAADAVGAVNPVEDPAWYEGPRGRTRVLHLSIAASFGLGFIVSETALKPALAPDACRWCDPPGIDRRVRDALVWDDFDSARTYSNLTGYVAVPALGLGLTGLASLTSRDPTWARFADDIIPVFETVTISQLLTQAAKFSVGRARPLVRFRDVADPGDQDNNLSFFSGHSALAFGITVSAGMVARWRDSPYEPVIWGVGIPLSLATAYLRIAADKHYFTDVVTGSLFGVAAGLTIPLLMRERPDLAIVPSGRGVALVGAF